jgi:hypothetical protein
MPEACDSRAYRNGKTFDQCRQEAREKSVELAREIEKLGQVPWSRVMESAGHDELTYKLALKYLRQSGFDIGNRADPRVVAGQMRK